MRTAKQFLSDTGIDARWYVGELNKADVKADAFGSALADQIRSVIEQAEATGEEAAEIRSHFVEILDRLKYDLERDKF